MQHKTEVVVVETSSKLVINYHKHPEVGGVGHVSLEVTHQGKTTVLSVYPTEDLTPTTPIAVTSMYVFPTKAVNHTSPSKSDSPIFASYDITEQVQDMDAVFAKAQELCEIIESGRAAFTLTPSQVTHTATAVLNSNTSTTNMMLGLKVMDRDLIDNEVDKVTVINCAEAISRVLEAGGIERPEGLLSFPTPSRINSYFAAMYNQTEVTEPEPELILEDPDAAPIQSQTQSTEEEPGLLRSMYNSVCSFFSSKGSHTSGQSNDDTTSYDQDGASHQSSSTSEPERVEQSDETPSREEDTSSPRASESSDSFFSSSNEDTSSVAAKKEDESDLDYCSRTDAMVN
ncbi:hypothetical protein [Legionella waltersii]|uniref:Uncharacterized protein n=1 Tax=Legionella waltersii TaxID=66969 RepID=A0A0W1ABV1_9GAMM|nr:hypothetical protein [Legionella waltersii]KTD78822.1 hypothetical protein Lwal_1592 [Legionella waltersii]SNV10963.1 Uncharacterised protein [Legionella waltersii]